MQIEEKSEGYQTKNFLFPNSNLLFWGAWFLIWLFLAAVVALQDNAYFGFRLLTIKVIILALMNKVGFMLQDNVKHLSFKLSLIILTVLIATIFNCLFDLREQPFSVIVLQELFNASTAMAIAFALRYGMNSLKAKQVINEADRLRKLAEQRTLNARLTPHVLYNMLNAIYSASLQDPSITSTLILALSQMMRHLTDSTDKDFIDAQSELQFMRNYAELTEAQLGNKNAIVLDFPEHIDMKIPNLLCATLFENAITHSCLHQNNQGISANFQGSENGFTFCITNTTGKDVIKRNGTSTGIAFVKKRLEYLYPGRHSFDAKQIDENAFRAKIKVW
jgi:sensor histidine kinase YesM